MNELMYSFRESKVRVVIQDNEPWFVAKDVCEVLGLNDTAKAVLRLDDDEKGTNSIPTPGGVQKLTTINEFGLYSMILTSRRPEAKDFKRWVTHEVIPSIRKTGSYSKPLTTTETLLKMLEQQVEVERKQLALEAKQIEQQEAIENISQIVSLDTKGWKDKTNSILNKIAISRGGGDQFQKVRNESYELLESRGRCKLSIRLENLKKNVLAQGIYSRSKITKLNKLDVIDYDTRLTEIYLAVVKDMAISYKVNIEGLGA